MTEELPQAACPMCGGTHLECSQAIFDGMDMMAFFEAERRLSEEGMDALRMVMQAAETLPGGLKEAWELAENVESLKGVLRDAIGQLPAHEDDDAATCACRRSLDGIELPFDLP